MNINVLKQSFAERGITKVKLGGCDIDGVMRGKYVSLDKFFSSLEGGAGFCDVIFGWDSADALYDLGKVTGWHTGYPDMVAKIDPTTMRFIPWEPGAAFFLLDFYGRDGQPLSVSPRQVLQRVVGVAAEMKLAAYMSVEYEYFLFQESAHSIREKDFRNLMPLSPGMFGYSLLRAGTHSELSHQIMDSMREYGVEIECFHTETGPGVYETAIKYEHVLRAADNAALFKAGVKELCARQGLLPTFMAKWNQNLPGCGGHLHQSLWDREGRQNLFGLRAEGDALPALMQHYLAGQLKLMPELTVLFCPTVNSYKRLVPNSWAPVNASWGFENRTTALRVIRSGAANSARVEQRLAGADANPYLAMAACLASGLYGIVNRLELGPCCTANAYSLDKEVAPHLPRSLEEAVCRFSESQFAREFFGEEFVEHYVSTREWEVKQFQRAVTNWEMDRYFEII